MTKIWATWNGTCDRNGSRDCWGNIHIALSNSSQTCSDTNIYWNSSSHGRFIMEKSNSNAKIEFKQYVLKIENYFLIHVEPTWKRSKKRKLNNEAALGQGLFPLRIWVCGNDQLNASHSTVFLLYSVLRLVLL